MANLGLSNASESRRFGVTSGISRRRKWETALHVALFSAAFLFVAAIVCGVGI